MNIEKDKFYIVRAREAGVFFGKIRERKGVESATMTEVRKLWYWSGAAAVEQLALEGVYNPDNCKFTVTVEEMEVANLIQIIPCTEKAVKRIAAVREWKI